MYGIWWVMTTALQLLLHTLRALRHPTFSLIMPWSQLILFHERMLVSPYARFSLCCWLCLQGFASHLRLSSRLHVHRLLCTLSAVSDRQSGGLIRSKGRFYSYINWVRFLVMLSFVVAVFHVWYICRYILVVSQRIIRHFMFQWRRMDCGCMEDWGSAHNSQLSV